MADQQQSRPSGEPTGEAVAWMVQDERVILGDKGRPQLIVGAERPSFPDYYRLTPLYAHPLPPSDAPHGAGNGPWQRSDYNAVEAVYNARMEAFAGDPLRTPAMRHRLALRAVYESAATPPPAAPRLAEVEAQAISHAAKMLREAATDYETVKEGVVGFGCNLLEAAASLDALLGLAGGAANGAGETNNG